MAKKISVKKNGPALSNLIRISRAVGKDLTLVQGGGGNTSVKSGDNKHMFIKASGTALKDMDRNNGWRRLRLEAVLSMVKDDSLAKLEVNVREAEVVNRLFLACDDDTVQGARPSVEAHLHSLLDKYVIHLHPNAVGAYVNAKNGKALLENLFKNEKLPPLWVPYTDPGFTLARKISSLIALYQKQYKQKPAILFLEKHGLFISAKNPKAGLDLVQEVVKKCSRGLKDQKAGLSPASSSKSKKIKNKYTGNKTINNTKLCLRHAFFEATGEYINTNFFNDHTIAAFASNKDTKSFLAASPITPDELVYANGPAMWIDQPDPAKITAKLKSHLKQGLKPALSFLVKDTGLFIAAGERKAAVMRDIICSALFIRSQAYRLGGIASLNKRQQQFINDWEAEAFRRTMVKGMSSGELKDRIAVVTGAGSGLGRSIALGLARAGAQGGLADIDQNAAQQTSELIKKELPQASTLILGCNVTNEEDIDNIFDFILNTLGGLDILVNAAGVAPAYALTDLPVDKWRFALEVNLTGYFLMGRAAARIMIRQQMGGSVINISSKSGIDASKNNTPYNATKAGELHMARGWAMELGEHNIRVNSICPGNVFEGSKIWNPEYIKVCAKKYGIKPEEVIPYYVNKTMLNKEIKGQDIADSVVFLSSDKARRITAQTLVVDSGQAAVR